MPWNGWQVWSPRGDLQGVLRQKQDPDTPWEFRVNRYGLGWVVRLTTQLSAAFGLFDIRVRDTYPSRVDACTRKQYQAYEIFTISNTP